MKKILTVAMILACLTVTLCGAVWVQRELWGWHDAGYDDGVQHAIEDSIVWTVTRYDPDDPDASAWGEYDQVIYIEVDGEVYAHGMYQG